LQIQENTALHALEKIMARAAGKSAVQTGEIVHCTVDLAGINDLYLQTLRSFSEMGGEKVHDPGKVVMFLDHYAPASTITQADNQKQFRAFCRAQGIAQVMDIDQGVCHQVLADRGLVGPGMLVVVTDSHTTTHGAFGAFGTGVGATDLAIVLITGKLWFRVPEVVRIDLAGESAPGVFAKDAILRVIGTLGADFGVYRAVEFTGSYVERLGIAERMVLCNMTTEMGAKTAYIQPDRTTAAFLRARGRRDDAISTTDPGYRYAAERRFDVTGLRPQVAAPHSVDNVSDIDAHLGKPIDQAYLGTCTGGRAEDIAVAARILKGRQIHPDTRFVVAPASKAVFLEAMARGDVQALVAAGATFVTPSCAACLGTHQGILAPGEVCITASSRNFPGRMGSVEAEIYVASPASVAAAALEGRIADPTGYLSGKGAS
jgi:3-isopropylmalate/(R)-2-methylmalate dehydratase large subunit